MPKKNISQQKNFLSLGFRERSFGFSLKSEGGRRIPQPSSPAKKEVWHGGRRRSHRAGGNYTHF